MAFLSTPSTTHVSFDKVYEPAEDSFFFLDTLSSESEKRFLQTRFGGRACQSQAQSESGSQQFPASASSSAPSSPSPLVVEIGTGSGVVISFLTRHANHIFGRPDVLTLGVDVNVFACDATTRTAEAAVAEAKIEDGKNDSRTKGGAVGEKDEMSTQPELETKDGAQQNGPNCSSLSFLSSSAGLFLDCINGSLTSALKPHSVDMLVFNPPYVPTDAVPDVEESNWFAKTHISSSSSSSSSHSPSKPPQTRADPSTSTTHKPSGFDQKTPLSFSDESKLLELSYAGGPDGMVVTNELLSQLPDVLSPERGVAYILLCARNYPEKVRDEMTERLNRRGQGEEKGEEGERKQQPQSQPQWQVDLVSHSGRMAGWERLSILRIARVVNHC